MLRNELRKLRQQKGLSQTKLTQLTGISPTVISNIENGKLYCYPKWRKKLAEALEVEETKIFQEGISKCEK